VALFSHKPWLKAVRIRVKYMFPQVIRSMFSVKKSTMLWPLSALIIIFPRQKLEIINGGQHDWTAGHNDSTRKKNQGNHFPF
jgi:hypothetical protein